MISGATGALAVVMVSLVADHGVEYLFAATILMGIFQAIAALLRLDLLMRFVSRSVITGFVNALAILIFMAQLPQLTGEAMTFQTYAMVVAGLAIIYGLPRITSWVPSPLAAIIVLAAGNPTPGVAQFNFGPAAGSQAASTRIRLAGTQDVVAIAKMADGSFVKAQSTVKVTIGGCGG